MEFSQYQSLCSSPDCRNIHGATPVERLTAYYRQVNERTSDRLLKTRLMATIASEISWRECERPYYNTYPAIADMLFDVSLDVPAKSVDFPHEAILVKLPVTYRRSKIETVLMSASRNGDSVWITVTTYRKDVRWFGIDTFVIDAQQTIEWANNNRQPSENYLLPDVESIDKKTQLEEVGNALRLAVGISILANDPNFVQPIVLNRDRLKYADADEATKAYLENRAARLNGRGFNVGEQLEKELAAESHDVSPHIRRPHMALFWTGKGRETPRLQLRRGCLVKPHDIMKVPTGFMDREPAIENTNDPF